MSSVAEARKAVFSRDGWQCIAPRIDPQAGPCYDRWGQWFNGFDPNGVRLTLDRVDHAPDHTDPTRMVTLCWGHHLGSGPNGGRQWGPANRDKERDWLARHG